MTQHFYENQPEITEADSAVILEDIFTDSSQGDGTVQEPESKTLPFTVQAPLGTWAEPWSDYAEEASVWMVYKWATGEGIGSRYDIAEELRGMGTWENDTFGSSKLTSIPQTLQILTDYLGFANAYLTGDISEASLKDYLDAGNVLIIPVNGQVLANPYYGDPAPEHHTIVLYDYNEEGFIANDSGTRRGEATVYSVQKILDSLQDLEGEQVMIVVGR